MRSIRVCLSLLLLLQFNATAAWAKSSAERSLDQLKTLIGSWSGKSSDGKPVHLSFRNTGAGSALLSEFVVGGPKSEEMISVFHLDGDSLLVTHYCSAGNQPRMKATASPDGKTISFDFFDATNLVDSDSGHMRSVVIALLDAHHHTETWTFIHHGKVTKQVFDLWRRASPSRSTAERAPAQGLLMALPLNRTSRTKESSPRKL